MSDITKKIGILGGGQLGKMLFLAGSKMGLNISCLDSSKDTPAAHVCPNFEIGDFKNYNDVLAFAEDKDIITIEIENVNTQALKELENQGKTVYPQASIIELIKDKGAQKLFYQDNNIPSSEFSLVENREALMNSEKVKNQEYPFVLKMRVGGYDGKGVQIIHGAEDLTEAFDVPSVIEDMVPIKKELSVIVARNQNGEIKSYPVVEMIVDEEVNLLDYLLCPAQISEDIADRAKEVAENLTQKLGIVGLLAVELFLTNDDQILVNEVAPRTHNSGHHSIEACYTSQFEQQLRAVMNLPLGETSLTSPAIMYNLLGEEGFTGPTKIEGIDEALSMTGVYPHIYGKALSKPKRKMGHLTIVFDDYEEAIQKLDRIKSSFKIKS